MKCNSCNESIQERRLDWPSASKEEWIKKMQYIIVDLEATCWQNSKEREKMEIIEIGAVRMNDRLEILDEFASFVKPIQSPILSDFCKKLTSIAQSDVDHAEIFPDVFPKFLAWIGNDPFMLCSWGNYDFRQFKLDCERHRISFPFHKEKHINLKQAMADLKKIKPTGMAGALEIFGLPLLGKHHRGIDDAHNIARMAQIILKSVH